MKHAWVSIASSVRAWRLVLLFPKRFAAEVRTLEAIRTRAFSVKPARRDTTPRNNEKRGAMYRNLSRLR
jgi:hypothetical protein